MSPMEGTMLWFNVVKDLGELTAADGERFAVLGSGFAKGEKPKGRCAGLPVTFSLAPQAGERRVADVRFVPEVAPRRARLRHPRGRG